MFATGESFPFAEVAVLFARADSVYKELWNCEVYDIQRDARTYSGTLPVIAHPPCRAWGRLRTFAKPRPDEKDLALFAVEKVRSLGGILEHPAASSLWPAAGLPRPRAGLDAFGGWTLAVPQFWWGHKADKITWLYMVGISPAALPPLPLVLGEPSHTITCSKAKWKPKRPEVSKAEREHTPFKLALWLVEASKKAKPSRSVPAGFEQTTQGGTK